MKTLFSYFQFFNLINFIILSFNKKYFQLIFISTNQSLHYRNFISVDDVINYLITKFEINYFSRLYLHYSRLSFVIKVVYNERMLSRAEHPFSLMETESRKLMLAVAP